MVAQALVEADTKLGERAYFALRDDAALDVKAVMWWYDTDAEEWRLLVATPQYEQAGPRSAYRQIRNVLSRNDLLERIPLRRVVAVSPGHPIVRSLARVFNAKVQPPANLTVVNCNVLGLEVAGAFIYDLKRNGAKTRSDSDTGAAT